MALLFFSFLCLLSSHAAPASPSLGWSVATAADELALLSFKSVLSAGPSNSEGLLASWNTSSHHCSWPGVVCDGRRHPERVVALCLGSSNLSGRISPSLGNLSFLRELDLGDNRLVGEIPPELGRLSKLRLLNLSTNSLHGNIPAAIGACTNLTKLLLRENHLQEYGAGNMVSTNGDVYSYGILVLETATGKRPTDSRFRQGLSLRECVEQALHHGMMDVVDARLRLDLENELQTMDDSSSMRKIDGLILLLRLGMSCSQEMPSSRMSTEDIIKELHAIKESIW